MVTILEGPSLTLENIRTACRYSVNKKGTNKKGVKRILWVERSAMVIWKDDVTRSVRFFVEKNLLWGEQLEIVRFLVTNEELTQWEKVEFSPMILPID